MEGRGKNRPLQELGGDGLREEGVVYQQQQQQQQQQSRNGGAQAEAVGNMLATDRAPPLPYPVRENAAAGTGVHHPHLTHPWSQTPLQGFPPPGLGMPAGGASLSDGEAAGNALLDLMRGGGGGGGGGGGLGHFGPFGPLPSPGIRGDQQQQPQPRTSMPGNILSSADVMRTLNMQLGQMPPHFEDGQRIHLPRSTEEEERQRMHNMRGGPMRPPPPMSGDGDMPHLDGVRFTRSHEAMIPPPPPPPQQQQQHANFQQQQEQQRFLTQHQPTTHMQMGGMHSLSTSDPQRTWPHGPIRDGTSTMHVGPTSREPNHLGEGRFHPALPPGFPPQQLPPGFGAAMAAFQNPPPPTNMMPDQQQQQRYAPRPQDDDLHRIMAQRLGLSDGEAADSAPYQAQLPNSILGSDISSSKDSDALEPLERSHLNTRGGNGGGARDAMDNLPATLGDDEPTTAAAQGHDDVREGPRSRARGEGGRPPPKNGARERNVRQGRSTRYPRLSSSVLTEQLMTVVNTLTPDRAEIDEKIEIGERLQNIARELFPGCSLSPYGSAASGFGLRNSDIDFCLSLELNPRMSKQEARAEVVESLAEKLESMGYVDVVALPKARMPVVKLTDFRTQMQCDICVNNHLALANTRLLKTYSMIDERLVSLVYCVKHWAKCRQVNHTYAGTLSSYAYAIMCIHHLQQCKPPVLPSLQSMHPITYAATIEGWHCEYFDDIEQLQRSQHNIQSLGQLLHEFFDYWAWLHDYKKDVITIRNARGYFSKMNKGWNKRSGTDRHLICIEDPFDTSHDLGRIVDKDSIGVIRGEFERAAEILATEEDPVPLLFEKYIPVDDGGKPKKDPKKKKSDDIQPNATTATRTPVHDGLQDLDAFPALGM